MSLIHVRLEEECAYVCVDTLMLDVGGEKLFEGSKMIPLVAANVVFALRGDGAFLTWVFDHYSTELKSIDYDTIAEDFLENVRTLFKKYAIKQYSAGFRGIPDMAMDVHLVGWSKLAGKPAGLSIAIKGSSFKPRPMTSGVVAPPISASMQGVVLKGMNDLFMHYARHQVAENQGPKMPIGGRLLMAKLTKEEISIRDLGKI